MTKQVSKACQFQFPSLSLSVMSAGREQHSRTWKKKPKYAVNLHFSIFFFFLLLVLFKEVRVNNCCLTCLGANYFTTSPIIYTILNHLKGAFKKAFRKKKLFGALDFFCRFGKLRQGSVFTQKKRCSNLETIKQTIQGI